MTQHQLPDMNIPAKAATENPMATEWWQAFVTKPEHMFMWFLLLILLFMFLSITWTYHKQKSNNINIMDLVSLDGKLDESKFNRFIAFVISSWGFIWLLTTGQLKEWFFMAYMAAWVGNALFNRYLRIRSDQIEKGYDLEKEVIETKHFKPKKHSYGKGMDIEPYDPEADPEEDPEDMPPANMKGRRRG